MRGGGRVVALLIVASVVAAACSGSDEDARADDTAAVGSSSTTSTTTTLVDDEPEFEPGAVAPLTGEPIDPSDEPSRPALVAKIGNNDDRARPQAGLVEADIVFEELIEGLKTRFAAVFHTEIPDRIGPVRSSRTSDIDIVSDLGTPYFAYSGANAIVLDQLRSAADGGVFVDIGILGDETPYSRDAERSAPDNLYFDYSAAASGDSADGRPVPLFTYGDVDPGSGSEVGAGITVSYPTSFGRQSTHVWDSAAAGWVRIQDGTIHLAETEAGLVEVAPTNVIVAVIDYVQAAADPESPQAVTSGSGPAWILTQGVVVEGTWSREPESPGWLLRDTDGDVVPLAPGSTWLLLAHSGAAPFAPAEIIVHDVESATTLLENARQIASGNDETSS